jgi:RNA polymerase sigma-70 factor (ECF subfamily)
MLSSVEIAWLLAAVTKGDRNAFEKLYATTAPKLYGVVLRIVRRHDLAAEVMEAVYLQIWRSADQYDPAFATPITWMVTMARTRAIDVARRPRAEASIGEPEIEDADSPGMLPRRELSDELKRLLTCIGRLEPGRQRMLLLAYYGAFSRDQLAVKLKMPVNLLKTALRRSLFEVEQCLTS